MAELEKKASLTFFQVENGNCCLIEIDNKRMAIDLKGTEEKSSLELLKQFLCKSDNKLCLDALCITHPDKDHCGGFKEFKEAIDNNKLIIGKILHPNYDRTKEENMSDLPDDYLALRSEIIRRKKISNGKYGNIEVSLSAGLTEENLLQNLDQSTDFTLKVLNPDVQDDESEWDVNDLSLVFNMQIFGLNILFTGDSSSDIWQSRIISNILSERDKKDWAKADILLASHHGSYKFFGNNREDVRDADPEPDNYDALNKIEPSFLIISANDKFPTKDSTGDDPPHYSAWKWYHKWFRDNRNIEENDKHPSCFKYTTEGHIRLEYFGDDDWRWNDGWTPDDDNGDSGRGLSETIGFTYRKGETNREGGHYAN